MRRMAVSGRKSARKFRGRASKTAALNMRNPPRGGFRL